MFRARGMSATFKKKFKEKVTCVCGHVSLHRGGEREKGEHDTAALQCS